MYPSFVTCSDRNSEGNRQMTICGQPFTAHFYDWYIDDAIMLANRWKPHQINYRRILYLRTWIRENYQHGHEIPYKHLRSLQGCRNWVESVIHAEYEWADKDFQESYQKELQQNKDIFSSTNSC